MPLFRQGDSVGGGFRIRRKVGEGQFSEVYEAERADGKVVSAP